MPTCVSTGPPYPEVTEVNCRVPSASFSQAPWYTLPVHLCRFRVRSICQSYFPDRSSCHPNPIRDDRTSRSSLLAGGGIFTPFPSATALALALGAGSPCADWPCAGTLGLSAGEVLTLLALLMSAFALPIPPANLTVHLHRLTERSATTHLTVHPQLRQMA